MRMFFTQDKQVYQVPFKNTLESIYAEHLNHCVQFGSGEIGFLAMPNIAIAPAHQHHTCNVVAGDGEVSRAYFLARSSFLNLSIFHVKRTPAQEGLRHRNKKLEKDSFLFRLNPSKFAIHMCTLSFPKNDRSITISHRNRFDFLPVFDKDGLFVGLTVGTCEGKLIGLCSHEVTRIINW